MPHLWKCERRSSPLAPPPPRIIIDTDGPIRSSLEVFLSLGDSGEVTHYISLYKIQYTLP